MSISDTIPQAANSGGLLLDSLEIKNFRAFRHLTIEKLGRVNLITGKNNVGKTSLLEALWLYFENGRPQILRRLLDMRDQLGEPLKFMSPFGFITTGFNGSDDADWLPYLSALFHDRGNILRVSPPAVIAEMSTSGKRLAFNVEWRYRKLNDAGEPSFVTITSEDASDLDDAFNASPFLSVAFGDKPPASFDFSTGFKGNLHWFGLERYRVCFIPAVGLDSESIAQMWDAIVLNDFRDHIIKAVRHVEPRLEAVELTADSRQSDRRVPHVRLNGDRAFRPMRELGDGVNHVFQMALALCNASNGVVFLDEVENGIHYSVLPDIWRLINMLAHRLNVQVFATTHSWDCIEAFQQAAAEDEDPSSGVLIRLQSENGDVTSTVFDERRLAVVTRQGIEVR